MKLFESLDDLKPFIFRITDNGGASADRFTVITCDGGYFAMSGAPFHPQGVGMTGERIDVQRVADRVETGEERDLRWIDLPADCQRCVMDGLNRGFEYYLETAPAAESREAARDWQGLWDSFNEGTPIYRGEYGQGYYIRDDEATGEGDPFFPTFRDAVHYMLPQDYDLSGPEYHTTVDLWDETDGPAELWDCEAEPATPYIVKAVAIDRDAVPWCLPDIGEARDSDHAREMGEAWQAANPDLAKEYQPAYVHKVDGMVDRLDGTTGPLLWLEGDHLG